MIAKALLFIAVGIILFELVEHLVFPLAWLILRRKKPSVSGPEGMIGQVAEVKEWHRQEGRVFLQGELWQAGGSVSFAEGEKAVVESVAGLQLRVKPLESGKEAKK